MANCKPVASAMPDQARAGTDTLLLFGPQFLTLNADMLDELRARVWGGPEQEWLAGAIESLPDCWDAFVTAFPGYAVVEDANQMLVAMGEWFRTGTSITTKPGWQPDAKLPNLVLSPLVVVAHLTEYMRFLDSPEPPHRQQQQQETPPVPAVLGFCTGLFSAFVAALAGADRDAVRKHGQTAVRLAMLAGGIVDAQGVLDASGPARAFATSWAPGKGWDALEQVLGRFPEVSATPQNILSLVALTLAFCH
ncbi:hypothetical protein VTK56DRAFT_6091 [Thermocarpiscus australiensis]